MGLAGRRIRPCYPGLQRFPEKGLRFKAISQKSLYALTVQLWTKTKQKTCQQFNSARVLDHPVSFTKIDTSLGSYQNPYNPHSLLLLFPIATAALLTEHAGLEHVLHAQLKYPLQLCDVCHSYIKQSHPSVQAIRRLHSQSAMTEQGKPSRKGLQPYTLRHLTPPYCIEHECYLILFTH